jgi:hypothetical protein
MCTCINPGIFFFVSSVLKIAIFCKLIENTLFMPIDLNCIFKVWYHFLAREEPAPAGGDHRGPTMEPITFISIQPAANPMNYIISLTMELHLKVSSQERPRLFELNSSYFIIKFTFPLQE